VAIADARERWGVGALSPAVLLGLAVAGLALLSLQRVPEFVSRDAFFALACRRQPGTAINLGVQVYDQVRYHGKRFSADTGALALQAAALPSVGRMLGFSVADTAVEAGVAAWRSGGRAQATRVLAAFPLDPGSADAAYALAEVLLGASQAPGAGPEGENPIGPGGADLLAEAAALLESRLGPALCAAAQDLAPRWRAGTLPDALPPVMAPAAAADRDAWTGLSQRHDQLRLLLALARVRERAGDGDGAFACAALALNLEPDDGEARWMLAGLYTRVLARPDLARRLVDGPGAGNGS
jgi:hypothetical protein